MEPGPAINDAEILRVAQRRLSAGERAGLVGLVLLASWVSSSSISPLLSSEATEETAITKPLASKERTVVPRDSEAAITEEHVKESRINKFTTVLDIYGSAEFVAPDLSATLSAHDEASRLSTTLASLARESEKPDGTGKQLEAINRNEVVLRVEGDRIFADIALPVSKLGMGLYDDRLLRVSGELIIEADENGIHVFLDPSDIEGRQPPGFIRQMVKRIDIYDLISQHEGFQRL